MSAASSQGTLSAREILSREYGSARNFMTPHRITVGKVARSVAYELSSGRGLEWGSHIYGVSVVRLLDSGETERDFDASACFQSLDDANQYVERLRAIEGAREDGYASGVAAGSWIIDGNTDERTARAVLRGIEDGDPAVMDSLPSSPLSGEWSGDPLPADVLASYDVDEDDDYAEDVLHAFEDAYSSGVVAEVERAARALVGASDA